MESRLARVTYFLISLLIVGHLLIVARSLLIPLIFAIFIWYLLNTVVSDLLRIPKIGCLIPRWLALLIAVFALFYLGFWLAGIITGNVNEVIELAPRYQERFLTTMKEVDSHFSVDLSEHLDKWASKISLKGIFVAFYGVFTSFTSNMFLIVLYVIFLFLEQQVMRPKLKALFRKKEHLKVADSILSQIEQDTQTYVGIKTLMSLVTAVICWLIMKGVGLDFSEFWAILIFFLNFIPNIGPIISTIFPAILAVIQFPPQWWPVAVVVVGVSTVQCMVGNFAEPKLMGSHLNLSPFVILVTLAVWGQLWGVVGMFLSVPMTVILMIIFSHFERTKPFAVLLSENGLLKD